MTSFSRSTSVAILALLFGCTESTDPPATIAAGKPGGGKVQTVVVTPAAPSILVGGVVQLTAVARDKKGVVVSDPDLTWSSSNSAIATVSQTGLVTGVGVGGPITITVSADPKKASDGIATVTVLPVFSIQDLGKLGGTGNYNSANDINEVGQVTGWAVADPGFTQRGFRWANGLMTNIGTLAPGSSSGAGINAAGHVVGVSSSAQIFGHAIRWISGTITDLGTLGGNRSAAEAINASGQIVGGSENAAGIMRAFLWQNGTMIDLGTLGGTSSYATDINDAGQIVGYSATASGVVHAFSWSNGVMTDLGSLLGGASSADGINAAGDIVGGSTVPNQSTGVAVLWRNGMAISLGSLPNGTSSYARDINDLGIIAGHADFNGAGEQHAVFWKNGQIVDLGTLAGGLSISEAYAINNSGKIVGSSTLIAPNDRRAVMWTLSSPALVVAR